jgi:peroxiredoxin
MVTGYLAGIILIVSTGLANAADEATSSATVPPGDWRFTFETPLGEMPFNLELMQDGYAWSAAFINGPERMVAEVTMVYGDSLVIEFPSYSSSLAGAMIDDQTMQGVARFNRRDGPAIVPFTATHNQSHRFFSDSALPSADVDGRWAITSISSLSPEPHEGLLELNQDRSVIVGTSMHTTGDSRFLTGELRGDELYLSTFDGGTGSFWRGTLRPDGSFGGKNYSLVSRSITEWSAKRNATAALADATKLTYLKDGYDRLAFTFPDLDGNMVSLDDERFKDKVVVITIGGSWCPTCHDETSFFSPFFNENQERGLEAVGLMYEYSTDFEKASKACRNYQRRYDVQYPMLIAGTADKEAAARTLPMINAVLVYPTMIIVDRHGKVRHIHTGFPGPATGEHHENFKRDFIRKIDDLLSEGV